MKSSILVRNDTLAGAHFWTPRNSSYVIPGVYDLSVEDTNWVLTSSFIIFTMQTGFGMLESGCVSIKNEVNIMMKNIIDIVLGVSVGLGGACELRDELPISCVLSLAGIHLLALWLRHVLWPRKPHQSLCGPRRLSDRPASGGHSDGTHFRSVSLPTVLLDHRYHHRQRCHGRKMQLQGVLHLLLPQHDRLLYPGWLVNGPTPAHDVIKMTQLSSP